MMSFKRLNELLALDPLSGQLYWKSRKPKHRQSPRIVQRWNDRHANKPLRDGRTVMINGVKMDKARIVLTLVNGRMIDKRAKIVHLNGDKLNFSYYNLATEKDIRDVDIGNGKLPLPLNEYMSIMARLERVEIHHCSQHHCYYYILDGVLMRAKTRCQVISDIHRDYWKEELKHSQVVHYDDPSETLRPSFKMITDVKYRHLIDKFTRTTVKTARFNEMADYFYMIGDDIYCVRSRAKAQKDMDEHAGGRPVIYGLPVVNGGVRP